MLWSKLITCFTLHGSPSQSVKQGCRMSLTLFSVYINDLAQEIKNLSCGATLDDIMVSMFLYADDIVLIAPTADNLQLMLNTLNSWCRKWRLTAKPKKTKV